MESKAKERIKIQLDFIKNHKNNIVIDADTHLTDTENMHQIYKNKLQSTPNYYHGRPINAEELLAEMNMANVDMCLIWQNPAATYYSGDNKDDYEALFLANKYIYECSNRYPEKFIPAGWFDPKALNYEQNMHLIDTFCKEWGFAIVKFNPAQNQFMLDDNDLDGFIQKIISYKAVPAFHFAADSKYTPISALRTLAEKYKNTDLLVVHMGGGGSSYNDAEEMYNETRQLGLAYPNLKFIESAKRDTHIESDFIAYTIAGDPFMKNIFCASDAPYGRQTWNFGGYRQMLNTLVNNPHHTDARVRNNSILFNNQIINNFLGSNFAEFYNNRIQCFLGIDN